MQKNKILKITLSILIVILISLVSFGGIFVKDKNRMKNILPEYKFGMELKGGRVFSIKPDETVNTEYYDKDGNKVDSSSIEEGKESEYTSKNIPINSEDILNKDNFDKTKKIVEDRLKLSQVQEYEIRENGSNGEIYITIPEDDYTDSIISQMTAKGEFKITDSEDEANVLITGDHIKDVKVGYGTQSTGQVVFINIEFDQEGAEKLQEISKTYTGESTSTSEITDESANEETDESTGQETDESADEVADQSADEVASDTVDETEETTNSSAPGKQVSLILDGETLLTTYFSQEITDGVLQLSMGGTTTSSSEEDLKDYLIQASNLAVLLKTENLPITYVSDTNLNTKSEIDEDMINSFIIVGIVIIVIMIAYTIVSFKKSGLLYMISLVGYVGLLLLVLRYTNVVLSLTGFAGIILSILMNYFFILNVLKASEKITNAFSKVAFKFITIYIPCLIIAVVFSFSKYLPISSFGMVMFYSIILMIIYHGIITSNLSDDIENK